MFWSRRPFLLSSLAAIGLLVPALYWVHPIAGSAAICVIVAVYLSFAGEMISVAKKSRRPSKSFRSMQITALMGVVAAMFLELRGSPSAGWAGALWLGAYLVCIVWASVALERAERGGVDTQGVIGTAVMLHFLFLFAPRLSYRVQKLSQQASLMAG